MFANFAIASEGDKVLNEEVFAISSDSEEWLGAFVSSREEWLKDHDFDPELLTIEEGFEIVIDIQTLYNEDSREFNSVISVMKRSHLS